MTPTDEKSLYETLTGGTDIPAAEADFSLEEILAEYGGSREQQILRDVEAAVGPEETPAEPAPVPEQPATPAEAPAAPEPDPAREAERARQEARDKLLAQAVDLSALERELPRAPQPISMEEVVSRTVDAVMEEQKVPLLKQPRRGLFSRRKLAEEDTETLYAPPEPEEEPDPEPIGREPELQDAAAVALDDWRRSRSSLPWACTLSLLPTLLLAAERFGVVVPYWSGDAKLQSLILLGCLGFLCLVCRQVFVRGLTMAARKRCTSELLISVSALLSAADCLARLVLTSRSAVMPYAPAACLALLFAQWSISRESRGMYDTFRAAAMDDEPPYLVTETEKGACKQRGSVPGFYTAAVRDSAAVLWQTVLLPVVLVASLVFGGLSSLGQGRGGDFLLNWSAILAAGASFALPLCWGLPFSRVAAHLQKTGCAVAGWSGAEKISRQKRMILTDTDLFPPGTIQLNGVKVFGEELKKAASYAAAMARAAGCGLERLFDGLERSETAPREEAGDFSFFKEGGYGATIHGESVLMGTASFMRKMDVRLPGGINLQTGVFLAVDKQLIAVFAVKYHPAENVDFALRMMRRSRITPILASRDPNITPALLKRKFYKKLKVEYPDLMVRVALSEAEKDRGTPRALLFREGLLPYAETVTGSRRLCRAVRRATALSLLGSAAGTLLAFYLVSLGSYDLLTPLALEVFLLLWTLPVVVIQGG